MANYEEVWDALARKVDTISAVKVVYTSRASSSPAAGLQYIPNDIPDTPAAVVMEDEPEDDVQVQGNQEYVTWRFQVRLYYQAAEVGRAVRDHALMKEQFLTAFRTDATLYGTCEWARIGGFGRLSAETINGKPYVAAPIRIYAVVLTWVQYTA